MRVQETTYEHLEISVLELAVNNAGNLSEKGFGIGVGGGRGRRQNLLYLRLTQATADIVCEVLRPIFEVPIDPSNRDFFIIGVTLFLLTNMELFWFSFVACLREDVYG